MLIRFWELSNREVVNCNDGKKLGHVGDIEMEFPNGCVKNLYVPCGGCIGKKGEYCIPIGCVVRIGVDIILVDIDEKKCKGKR